MQDRSDHPVPVSTARPATATVLTMQDIGFAATSALLARYGLRPATRWRRQPIPGSYWGEREAGIIGCTVYARDDTPVHSPCTKPAT